MAAAGRSKAKAAISLPLEEKIAVLSIEIANLEAKMAATGITALSSRSRRQTKNELVKKKSRLEDLFVAKGYEGLGMSKNNKDSAEPEDESKDSSAPVVTIEDTLEPESNDQARLVRQIRISESLKDEIEKSLSSFDANFKEDEEGILRLRAESTKIFELQSNYIKVMDSVLNSCSATDFERLSSEKYRIQG